MTWAIKSENQQQLTLIPDQLTDLVLQRWESTGEPRKEKTEDRLYLADNIAAAVFMRELQFWFLGTGVSYGQECPGSQPAATDRVSPSRDH